MRFVQNFTPPDFQAKTFTPSISPNFRGKNTFIFYCDSDNKEHTSGTIGQTKSLHGKPFPTASQLQRYSRFKEGWRHPLLGLICVEDGKCRQEGNLAQLLEEKLLRLDFDFELFEGVDD